MARIPVTPKNEMEALIQLTEAVEDVRAELGKLNMNMERIILAVAGGEPRPHRPNTRP